MSLKYSASTHISNHGTSAKLRQDTGFFAAWVLVTSFVSGVTGLKVCGTDGTYWGLWLDGNFDGSGMLYFDIQRATTDLKLLASSNAIIAGIPQFVAASWHTAGSNSDQKLYKGDLVTPVAEISSYTTQQVGSGTRSVPSTAFTIGNALGGESYSYFNGIIDSSIYLNRQPLLKEIIELQKRMYVAAGTQILTQLGISSGLQIDISGNSNHGSVTGAASASPLPLNFLRQQPNYKRLLAQTYQERGGFFFPLTA